MEKKYKIVNKGRGLKLQETTDLDLNTIITPDATTIVKGKVKLAGDIGGTADLPTVPALILKAPLASPTFTGTVNGITKTMVGLSNVDNISDINKPISTATQTALDLKITKNSPITGATKTKITYNADGVITSGTDLIASDIPNILESQVTGLVSDLAEKEPIITAGTTAQYRRGDNTWQTLDKTAVGLSNIDNTSDANKPVSTTTQTALNLKANLAGTQTFTGVHNFPTASLGTSTGQAASTLFVANAINSDVTIQKIINNTNRLGELDGGNSYIYAMLGGLDERVFSIQTGDGTIWSSLSLDNGAASLLGKTATDLCDIRVSTGVLAITQSNLSTGKTLTIGADSPIADTTINTPALPTGAYTYSVATTNTDSTTIVKTSATLDSEYPLARPGDEVQALSIIAGGRIYKKTSTGWAYYLVTINP